MGEKINKYPLLLVKDTVESKSLSSFIISIVIFKAGKACS